MSFLLDLVARVARQQAGSHRNLQSPWRSRPNLSLFAPEFFPRLLIHVDERRNVKRHGVTGRA